MKKFLPIGTVVSLKDSSKKVMIISYLIYSTGNDKPKMYDYGGCLFPEGVIESSHAIGFDHDSIDEIVHLGYIDDDQKKFNEVLVNNEKTVKTQYDEAIKQSSSN